MKFTPSVPFQLFDIHSPSVAAGEDALKVIRSAERVGFEPTVLKVAQEMEFVMEKAKGGCLSVTRDTLSD